MPKRVHLESHLPTAELEQRYRKAQDPVERSHYQIIWLLAQAKPTREVAAVTGYSPAWIREIARRYNEQQAEGLGDRRHRNPGGAERALLDPPLKAELGHALQASPPDGGLWTSRKVAEWIAARIGRDVSVQRGWEALRGAGRTPQVPRPAHAKADPAQQEQFRKNSPGG